MLGPTRRLLNHYVDGTLIRYPRLTKVQLNKRWLSNPINYAKYKRRVYEYYLQRKITTFPGDERRIASIYQRARELTASTRIQHSVDHIVPLKGRRVSGLHVSWNLEVIPLKDNMKKGNRFNGL